MHTIFCPSRMNDFEVKLLTQNSLQELQAFIDLFNDFFQLCEGKKGSAAGILTACPPTKDIQQDKFVLGFYQKEHLLGLIDLIANYPQNSTWTIGYLLIHPSYQRQGLGAQFFHVLEQAISPNKMRCVVQEQNERAFKFWQTLGFKMVYQREDNLGKWLTRLLF
ncbi:GNAT family N-acetyltransferase [Legionella busanensis]|nr:GNAT family N-acetyltransferase [Legionella busanensis]